MAAKKKSAVKKPKTSPTKTPPVARARARKKIEQGKTPDSIPTEEQGEKLEVAEDPHEGKRVNLHRLYANADVYRLSCDFCDGVGQGTEAEMIKLRDQHVQMHIPKPEPNQPGVG